MEQNLVNFRWKMNNTQDSTETLIESLHANRQRKAILIHSDFLDDEKLPEKERIAVLNQIFNQKIRQKQLSRIISHLTPVLDRAHPPSALIYGPTGSGKTVSMIHVLSKFQAVASRRGIGFRYVYIDLTSPKTYFGALNEAAIAIDGSNRRYRKGIPIEYMQTKIKDAIKKETDYLCLLIDEADNIQPNPDGFLTFFAKTLPRKVECRLILILLTNRLDWEKTLDPRILSFLKKSDIIFEPYNALDLLSILKLRAEKALKIEKVDPGALKKIAAIASRETGDARKAVDLLAKAVQVAEDTTGYLGLDEVDLAERKLEVDKTTELIRALAEQQRLALKACYTLLQKGRNKITTGDSYEIYKRLCEIDCNHPLTQRRFCDMISFLDLYGLINARVVSRGRYGKTREIMSSLPNQVITQFLTHSISL